MQVQQLKEIVIDKIYGIEDIDYLQALSKILDSKRASGNVHRTTKEQKELIAIGLQQLANGEVVSNEELEAEEDEWLNA